MTDEYRNNLLKGNEFQDFATVQLLGCGIIVNQFSSSKYQNECGESLSGIEIKYDGMFRKTGNFYIEYQEKSNKNNPNYVDSGILRNDNTWLWAIGDYLDIYIVPKESLKRLYSWTCAHSSAALKSGIRFAEKETSRGMLVPVPILVEKYVAKHIFVKQASERNEWDSP